MSSHDPILGIELSDGRVSTAIVQSGDERLQLAEPVVTWGPALAHRNEKGELRLGWDGAAHCASHPSGAAVQLASVLGLDREAPVHDASLFPYPVASFSDGGPVVSLHGESWSATSLVTQILARIRSSLGDRLGQPLRFAGIAFPSWYSSMARRRLQLAAEGAGFEKAYLLPSTTATAIALREVGERGTLGLVEHDLWGFQLAKIELSDGSVEIERHLGRTMPIGADLVSQLARFLVEPLAAEVEIDRDSRPRAVARLRLACETALAELRRSPKIAAGVSTPFLALAAAGPRHLDAEIGPDQLRSIAHPVIDAFQADLGVLLKGADVDRISRWSLSGEAPSLLFIAQALRARAPWEVRIEASRVRGAAEGAALYAARRAGLAPDLFVLQVASHALGIRNPDGGVLRFVDRFAPLPSRVTGPYSVTALEREPVEVIEGEVDRADEGVSIATFRIPAAKGPRNDFKRIELVLDAGVDGDLSVGVGAPGSFEVTPLERVDGPGPNIAQLGEEIARLADHDRKVRDLQRARLMLDAYVLSLRRMLGEGRGPTGAGALREIGEALRHASDASEGVDPDQMRRVAGDLARHLRGGRPEIRAGAEAP